jgi:hypothetical protein
MKYTDFVKANYDKVTHLPVKERMAKLGQMWKASGHSSPKGKGVAGGSEGGMFIKRKGGKGGKGGKGKRVRGKGIISDVLGSVGLGVEPEGGNVVGGDAKGSGIFSDLLGSVGMGMKKRGRKPKGGNVVGGATVGGDAQGAGIFSDLLGSVGMGMKKRGRKSKGGNVVGGDAITDQIMSLGPFREMHNMASLFGLGMAGKDAKGLGMAGKDAKGSGILDGIVKSVVESVLGGGVSGGAVAGGDAKGSGLFSSILGSVGLGMPDKIKSKHLNRMIALEKELHKKGKLSPNKHRNLKVYHTLHGSGFFDTLLNIGKKAAGAVAALPTILKVIPEAAKYVPDVLTKVAPLAAMV